MLVSRPLPSGNSFKSFASHSRNHLTMPQTVFYAVKIGRNPGIYTNYEDAMKQTIGFSCGSLKKFKTLKLAQDFLNECSVNHDMLGASSGMSYRQPKCAMPVEQPKEYIYAVHKGRKPGIYNTWDECSQQVLNFKDVSYRKFDNINDAAKFVKSGAVKRRPKRKMSSWDNFVMKRRKLNARNCKYVLQNPGNPVEVFTCGAVHYRGEERQAGIGVYWGPNHPLNTSKRITKKQTILRAKIYAVVHALNQAKKIGVNNVALHTNFQSKNLDAVIAYIRKYKALNWIINAKGEIIKNKDVFVALDSALEGINFAKVNDTKVSSMTEASKLADIGCLLPLLTKNISEWETVCNKTNLSNSCDKISMPRLNDLDSKIEIFLKTNTPSTSNSTSTSSVPNERIRQIEPFYAVYKGHVPGIYTTWENCRKQLINFPNSVFKHFYSEEKAQQFVLNGEVSKQLQPKLAVSKTERINDNFVNVFIDGSSFISDSVRAGIGVYWSPGNILNTSLRLPDRQTNNRAEMWAAVLALHQAKQLNIKSVRIHTDSQFVIKVVTVYLEICREQNCWKIAEGIPAIYEQDFKALNEAMAGLQIDWCYVSEPKNCPEIVEAERLAVAGCSKIAVETVILE